MNATIKEYGRSIASSIVEWLSKPHIARLSIRSKRTEVASKEGASRYNVGEVRKAQREIERTRWLLAAGLR